MPRLLRRRRRRRRRHRRRRHRGTPIANREFKTTFHRPPSQTNPFPRPSLMDLPVHLDDIHAARARIAPFINSTPILSSSFFSSRASAAALPSGSTATINLMLKAESMQKTGSFKIRGATNAVRAMLESGDNDRGGRAATTSPSLCSRNAT